METDVIRVAILAPLLAIRVGLRTLLSSDAMVEVVAEGLDFASLESYLEGLDVIVLQGKVPIDSWVPRNDIKNQLAFLWVTDDPQAANWLRGISCRAWGIVNQDATEEELLIALHAVEFGNIISPPQMLEPLLTEFYRHNTEEMVEALTPRETEILQLLAQGLPNKQIAMELEISEHTVKFHISSIYGKLNATNRTEAVRLGLQAGLIVL
jgi:DNA-binding NarL/FixJ family response regulator